MAAEKLSTVIPVDDLEGAVRWWSEVLSVEPTFVDGDRWAQFDLGGTRLSLAGADRSSDRPGVLVKVDDLDATRAALVADGHDVSVIATGPHERRCTVEGADGVSVTLYAPS